ncbi:hypothetical protein GALMADRAFT_144960 [Galerina marginata CBS 339.88]|uniref:SET domain-containing protein n=1 Tax=Galerina marginata (strain CBS 339.88) TaxID=685588 RepID=A0A067SHB8_GALM3|nr:hypothetical protein GALMADRAFT_144960 [Galerina marginata CBS 339.88]
MEPFGHSIIWSMFEKVKHNLNFQDPLGYIATVKKLATSILLHYPSLVWENKKKESLETLSWCITAYSLVINPAAIVHLKVKPLGHAKQKGFAIYANKDIIQGEYIQELLGLMPEDRAEKYTDLSTITPHKDNRNDGSFEEKLLIGPIRFINHRCVSYNVEFIAIRDTYAFTIMATKNIKAKEEILLCYGVDYFKENGSECLCEDCREIPDEEEEEAEVSKKGKDQINIEERDKAKKDKRAKQKEKRKLGPN